VRVARGVVAAEALRGALWGALEERGERRGEVASRLAHVCSVLAAADPADARGAIARALAGGRPFIVTLVELDGLERLLRAELEPAALAAVQDALGTLDELVCESPGRYWLIGAGADPERVREVVAGAASHHGAALSAAVGIARWPGDGDGADELAAAAESALYVALAGG
jgi:GGDEF domain-containing protein